jgi:hypothetical protein
MSEIIPSDIIAEAHLELIGKADSSKIKEWIAHFKSLVLMKMVQVGANSSSFNYGSAGYKELETYVTDTSADLAKEIASHLDGSMLEVAIDRIALYSQHGPAGLILPKQPSTGLTAAVAVENYGSIVSLVQANTALAARKVMGVMSEAISKGWGITDISKKLSEGLVSPGRQLQGTVSSARTGTANFLDGEIAKLNPEIMTWKRYNARFERGTCSTCIASNGTVYKASGGVVLPRHAHCACFYTYFTDKPSASDYKDNFSMNKSSLQAALGKKLGSLVFDGKVGLNEVIKPTLNGRGELVDIRQLSLRDVLAKNPRLK